MKGAVGSGVHPRESLGHCTAKTADALGEILRERRRGIQRELERLFRRFREEECPPTGDDGERAAHVFNCELGSARVDQLTQIRRQIDGALARNAEGRYGRCVACDMEISVARLRSLPFALYCRDCQAAAEEKRAVPVGPIA